MRDLPLPDGRRRCRAWSRETLHAVWLAVAAVGAFPLPRRSLASICGGSRPGGRLRRRRFVLGLCTWLGGGFSAGALTVRGGFHPTGADGRADDRADAAAAGPDAGTHPRLDRRQFGFDSSATAPTLEIATASRWSGRPSPLPAHNGHSGCPSERAHGGARSRRVASTSALVEPVY